MQNDVLKTDDTLNPAPPAGGAVSFPRPNRGMIFDSLGLACYIAWSFVMWNGSSLFGDLSRALPFGEAQTVQALLTALAALLLVMVARQVAPLRKRVVLLSGFAVISSVAIVVAALSGSGEASVGWMLVAFGLSGVGSTLRLGWEERLSAQGVERTAVCAGTAYLFGFLIFFLVSLLPAMVVLIIGVLLPLVALALLLVAVRGEETHGADDLRIPAAPLGGETWQARLSTVPWKLMAAIALAFFSYGATRANGVVGVFNAEALFPGTLPGIPALASFVAIVLAYVFYRKNPTLAFYLAFPLMAVASLLPATLDPFAGGTTFSVALIGAELVKYLVWFLLIDSIIKDGAPALLCLAFMRCAQWGGSFLGQIAADVLPSPETVAIAILLSLMLALLVIVGSPAAFKAPVVPAEDAADALARRVAQVAERCKLSPREQEVLAIWATGHTGAYIEKKLFISKNTVKTHLNHIYAKTKTSNREELLELLESVDQG